MAEKLFDFYLRVDLKNNMFVINHKKIFFIFSAIVVIASILSIIFYGLNFSIDFTGGSIVEVEYLSERPDQKTIEAQIDSLGIGESLVQTSGEHGYIIRTRALTETEHPKLLSSLSIGGTYELEEKRFNTIGPTIGTELRKKAWIAIIVVIVAIILFIAFAFRKVSHPVSSWKYGLIAIVALIHDIIVPAGVFAFLGSKFMEYQIDILFVMALLAILGFSVNDTIVVFDRIRENLRINREYRHREEFSETVGKSLQQTYARSLNTSLTTLAVLVALYFFGGESTQQFALVLSIGVVAGTYSSIFLASPLLVVAQK